LAGEPSEHSTSSAISQAGPQQTLSKEKYGAREDQSYNAGKGEWWKGAGEQQQMWGCRLPVSKAVTQELPVENRDGWLTGMCRELSSSAAPSCSVTASLRTARSSGTLCFTFWEHQTTSTSLTLLNLHVATCFHECNLAVVDWPRRLCKRRTNTSKAILLSMLPADPAYFPR